MALPAGVTTAIFSKSSMPDAGSSALIVQDVGGKDRASSRPKSLGHVSGPAAGAEISALMRGEVKSKTSAWPFKVRPSVRTRRRSAVTVALDQRKPARSTLPVALTSAEIERPAMVSAVVKSAVTGKGLCRLKASTRRDTFSKASLRPRRRSSTRRTPSSITVDAASKATGIKVGRALVEEPNTSAMLQFPCSSRATLIWGD